MDLDTEIGKAAREDRVVVGFNETFKKLDSLDSVVLASNAPVELAEKIRKEAGEDKILEFDGNNEDLGSICGKPFSASVVGLEEEDSTGL